jgi:hypothetical protein
LKVQEVVDPFHFLLKSNKNQGSEQARNNQVYQCHPCPMPQMLSVTEKQKKIRKTLTTFNLISQPNQ